jgi:hypothetical protein
MYNTAWSTDELLSGIKFKEAKAVDPSEHAFGIVHLKDYVLPKLHHFIRERRWHTILVTGRFSRKLPYVISDTTEKREKRFNWYRPTARILPEGVLEVACFPGQAYVEHYAIMIATFLNLEGELSTKVHYEVSYDRLAAIALQHFEEDLQMLEHADVVILGYVEQMVGLMDGQWKTRPSHEDTILRWHQTLASDGKKVVFLGCMVSFWGDISVQLIRALQSRGTQCIIYAGKTGALVVDAVPNMHLATGSESFVGARTVSWNNVLYDETRLSAVTLEGAHTTTPTPLLDTKSWVSKELARGAHWVDCEVGLMAEICNSLNINFGYLHIVSDNVAVQYEDGIWNESCASVQEGRSLLYLTMSRILAAFLHIDLSKRSESGEARDPREVLENEHVEARMERG